jgi:lipopolysaccharide transport system permease protein
LLRQFVRREIEARYRGSALGIVWSLVTPLLMLSIYTFVFSVVLNARWRGEAEGGQGAFAVTLFAGLIAFNVFSEVVNRAPTLIVHHPNYVKKVVFPLEILPVSALGAALFQALINVAILVAANLLITGTISSTLVLLPVAVIPLIGLGLGLGWFLASLGVYLRDIAYIVGLVTQVLFFLSAIFYPVEAVPESLRPLLYLNPLTTIVESFRRTLVWNLAPDWTAWAVVSGVAGMVFLLGYTWFMKTKTGFADVI